MRIWEAAIVKGRFAAVSSSASSVGRSGGVGVDAIVPVVEIGI